MVPKYLEDHELVLVPMNIPKSWKAKLGGAYFCSDSLISKLKCSVLYKCTNYITIYYILWSSSKCIIVGNLTSNPGFHVFQMRLFVKHIAQGCFDGDQFSLFYFVSPFYFSIGQIFMVIIVGYHKCQCHHPIKKSAY